MLGKWIGKGSQGAIGLEFALQELHMVQLVRRGDGIAVRARALVDYPLPRDTLLESRDDCRALLRRALKEDRFRGRDVISVLPAGGTRILPVTYTAGGKLDDEGEIILDAVADRLQGELSDYVIDYMPIRAREGDRDRVAMVVVARKSTVLDYLALLDYCGLRVQALDIGPMAIRRLVSALSGSQKGENVLVINFGYNSSFLTMISGRRLLFDTEIEFGEQPLVEQVAAALDMSQEKVRQLALRHGIEEAAGSKYEEIVRALREILKPQFLDLVDEVQKALVYAAGETRGEPVRHIYTLGSIARWPGTATLLGEMLSLQIETIPDPVTAFAPTQRRRRARRDAVVNTNPEMAVATGLALRGIRVGS